MNKEIEKFMKGRQDERNWKKFKRKTLEKTDTSVCFCVCQCICLLILLFYESRFALFAFLFNFSFFLYFLSYLLTFLIFLFWIVYFTSSCLYPISFYHFLFPLLSFRLVLFHLIFFSQLSIFHLVLLLFGLFYCPQMHKTSLYYLHYTNSFLYIYFFFFLFLLSSRVTYIQARFLIISKYIFELTFYITSPFYDSRTKYSLFVSFALFF